MSVLVTGGLGYIGSHMVVSLLSKNMDVVIIDNESNSKPKVLDRIERITGKRPGYYKADVRDEKALLNIFKSEEISAVIHFAALKAVEESVKEPAKYYENNVLGTVALAEAMKKSNIFNLIYSSSATVYGVPERVPLSEDMPVKAFNPYGETKIICEMFLNSLYKSDKRFNIAILRYFNPAGAHESGLIGEDPKGIPNNIMPYISKVALGKLPEVNVFGNDYKTRDGTGIRDYIHINDLIDGHMLALEKLSEKRGVMVYNLGTGLGYSVIELIEAYKKASGKDIPYRFKDRREGDIAECYAAVGKAERELGFKAKRNLFDMCESAYKWQTLNPDGYDS